MANRLDVAARLDEGRPAVEHTQSYVWACHALGYQNPDLTLHASQVRDWYDSEDGLDLWVLDDDCARLRAAANATDEALSRQRAQLAEFVVAWRGLGADSATGFLRRHCDAGEAVAAAVRGTAERCAALRDDLWQLVDRKVAKAIAIDDRRLAERPAWLAAAQTVTTGAGDRSVAEQLVKQQVEPHVDNDIRADWLTVMRSTVAAVDASFDAVTEALTAAPAVRFELPGDLAFRRQPLDEPLAPIAATVSVPTASASWGATPSVEPAAAHPDAAVPPVSSDSGLLTNPPPTFPAGALNGSAPVPPLLDSPLEGAAGLPAGTGDLGGAGGLGGLAGSIGGVVGQIVGGIGSLLDSLADGLADPSVADDASVDDELDADGPEEEGDAEADDEPDGEDAEPADADDGVEPAESATPAASPSAPETTGAEPAADEPAAPQADSAPLADVPPPAEPPPADPGSDEATPCEIAADELPQIGQ